MDRLQEVLPEDPRCAERHEDELRMLLAEQGEEVETAFLSWVRREYPEARIVDLSQEASEAARGSKARKARAAARTLEALEEADVVYQAPLFHGRFFGIADFVVRRGPLTGEEALDHPSALAGSPTASSFFVWDTKLARSERPLMLVQLGCYADALQVMAGGECEQVGLVLGMDAASHGEVDGHQAPALVSEARKLWEEFLAFQDAFDARAEPPDPGEASFASHGPWERLARRLLLEADDVRILYRMTAKQRQKLRDAGFGTCRSLAAADPKDLRKAGLTAGTADRLQRQARLQRRSVEEESGRLVWEPLPTVDQALAALPRADPGDLFLDLEGDPTMSQGSCLQYLFGLATRDGSFFDWWAHDAEAEVAALSALGSFVEERRSEHPGLHVYHYGHYERSALGKIAERLPRDERAARELLAIYSGQGLLVDLLVTVRDSLEVSLGGYGLKQVEKLYRDDGREATVADAASSLVEYKRWRAKPDGASWEESPRLRSIREVS